MPTVLVLSCPGDAAADMVVDRLARHQMRVVRFDTADFPLRAELAAFPGQPVRGALRVAQDSVDLDDVVGVLYRRPARFQFPHGMLDEHRVFATAEARHGFGGVLASLPARWANHPSAVSDAHFKPRQLDMAAMAGMTVPRTVITNSPAQAAKFAAEIGRPVVYKAFEPAILPGDKAIFTSVVDQDHWDDPAISLTAHLFQERIPKAFDARITVIAHQCFGVAVHAHSDVSRIDFRADYDSVTYTPLKIPGELESQLRDYLDHFGLVFGAFDFAVTQDGEYVFLECNPNGQWGWLEDETGLPMAAAFAEYLAEG